jgi:cyanophycin synthetase
MGEETMRIAKIRRLRGPNIYCSHPVAVVLLDLRELTGQETTDVPGFTARLLGLLPGLAEHHCAASRPGGLLDKMNRGTYFGHVLEHVTLELSHLIGREVCFGRTLWAGEPGQFKVIIECPDDEWAEDPVVEQLLTLALGIVTEVAESRAPDLGPELSRIADVYDESRLGVSAAGLARAARERDIPVRRLSDVALLQLGQGCHRQLVWAASTEQTSAIGVDIAGDKVVTKQLLAAAGIPVPEGIVAHSAEEAMDALDHLGAPVVVKPVSGHHGRNIFVASTAEEVSTAWHAAGADGGQILVESYVAGSDYRVLVVGDRVAAAQLSPAQVIGDGICDIAALVDQANSDPRRGTGHDRPLTKIVLDNVSIAHLAGQGLAPMSVPALGQIVRLRSNANLSTGGTSTDVTDSMHPAVARMCARVAAVTGLDVCGIDLRLTDISQPLAAGHTSGCVIEINTSPGLRMHLHPSEGRPRDVAGHIIDQLYPPGAPSRIPIVSVTGTNGKTTTVRLIAHILRHTGLHVGMTSTEGVYIGDDLIHASDASGPRSADMVLGDPAVQAAVLETARGGIVRRGLGYDRADVAVVTNISNDHLGTDGIDTMDDLVTVKSLVAEEITDGGQLVLNADDCHCPGLTQRPAVRDRDPVVRYFSLSPINQVVTGHLRLGGIAYLLEDGWLVEAEGARRAALAPVRDVPQSWDGHAGFMVANVLAALAATRALGVPAEDIRGALASFEPSRDNPGRIGIFRIGEVPVVLDYAHNPAALSAAGSFVQQHWGRTGVAVLTLPGDRTNALVTESAHAVARAFDRVVVYEDLDLRGREPGEMTKLISSALTDVRPGIRWEPAADLGEAVTLGVTLAAPADPVLLVYEKIEPVIRLLERLGAHGSLEPQGCGSGKGR